MLSLLSAPDCGKRATNIRSGVSGFTLIELLVVVAIIVVLIAILLPSLGKAREQAKQTACMSNIRQVGLSLYMYRDEFNDYMPNASTTSSLSGTSSWCDWIGLLQNTGNMASTSTMICPSDRYVRNYNVLSQPVRLSYGMNESLVNPLFTSAYVRVKKVPDERRAIMPVIADSTFPVIVGYNASYRARVTNANDVTSATPLSTSNVGLIRHAMGSVVYFVDDHVEVVNQSTTMSGYTKYKFNYSPSDFW